MEYSEYEDDNDDEKGKKVLRKLNKTQKVKRKRILYINNLTEMQLIQNPKYMHIL